MTATFRGLDFGFTVTATDPTFRAAVEHAFAACRVDGTADVQYTLLDRGTDTTRIALFENDKRLLTTSDEALAFAYLVWQVSQRVVAESGRRLLLHAAAAAHDGSVVLLPAPSGAGKSTLVAGLVASGFRYLTDDVCAIDLDTGRAWAYPKPIAIAARALPTLDLAHAATRDEWARFAGDEVYLSVADLAGSVAVDPLPPRLVVVPDYAEGAPTDLHPLTRAETAVLIAEQSFNFDALAPTALVVIADMLRRCSCYRLTYSDLRAGVRIVSDLIANAHDATAAHSADEQ